MIRLEAISVQEYDKLMDFWKKNFKKLPNEGYARIVETLIDSDFERFVCQLSELPLVYEISFREDGKWSKLPVKDARLFAGYIAKCAENDKGQTNFLEVHLRDNSNLAFYEAAKCDGKLALFKVNIPYSWRGKVGFKGGVVERVKALWVP